MKTLKTNYPGHEAGYRFQRDKGAVGWNATDDTYDQRHVSYQQLIDAGLWPETGSVLEMGCGAGNTSVWLAKNGFRVVGVDISPTAIEWAQERAKAEDITATFIVGDVLNLEGQKTNQFDLVIDSHCLHCIIGEDRQRFLSEAFRTAKPGGVLWIETMSEPVRPEALQDYDPETRCLMTGEGEARFAGRYIGTRKSIEAEIVAAGFKLVSSNLDPQLDDSDEDDGVGMLTITARKPRD